MFILEKAIAQWRRQMLAAGMKAPMPLDELESHLRDEIEQQMQSGLNAPEALEVAVQRLGQASALKAEFTKASRSNRWPRFMQCFYYVSVSFVLLIGFWTLLEFKTGLLVKFLGLSVISLITFCLACLPYLLKSLPPIPCDRIVRTIKLTSSLVWMWVIWELLAAEHIIHFELGIVVTMVMWSLCAAIALSTLAYGLNDGSRRPGSSGSSPPLLPPSPQPNPATGPCPPDFGGVLPPSKPLALIAQHSLEIACVEATRLGHDFVGTEHLLLGVLKPANGPFAELLQRVQVDRETVRLEIERLVSTIPPPTATGAIPFTPRARKALHFAAGQAKALNHSCINVEHIFLGLLLEGGGMAAQALKNLGIHIGRTRKNVLSELRSTTEASAN